MLLLTLAFVYCVMYFIGHSTEHTGGMSMVLIKLRSLLLAGVIGLAAVFILLGLLGGTSVVLAKEQDLTGRANLAQMAQAPSQEFALVATVYFSPAPTLVTDLAGNVIGLGGHTGEVRCWATCNKKTQLDLLADGYEYQFKTLQALDPEARRMVVAGKGTIYSDHQKATFLFTATFEDNGDGTVAVTYVASSPDASFVIPKAPGTFEIASRP
jgi:hypothetical protein